MRTITRILLLLQLLGVVFLPIPHVGAQSSAHFVVAVPGLYPLSGDSYILVLTDPADISVARALVANGDFAIVVARVSAGSDGINRDVIAPGEPKWSWHVKEFLTFADAATEICDGSPTQTEQVAQSWPPDYEETICYWSYTVVAEIPPSTPVEETNWGAIKALFSTALPNWALDSCR
jgi:hypothetical protein